MCIDCDCEGSATVRTKEYEHTATHGTAVSAPSYGVVIRCRNRSPLRTAVLHLFAQGSGEYSGFYYRASFGWRILVRDTCTPIPTGTKCERCRCSFGYRVATRCGCECRHYEDGDA